MPRPVVIADSQSDDVTTAAPAELSLSIVSGSYVVREGLAALLTCLGHAPPDSCQTFEPFPELQQSIAQGQVVLMDGAAQVAPTLDWIRSCSRFSPATQIMVIELTDSIDPILAYMRAGVRAYTLRGAPVAEIVTAIQALRLGHGYCSPSLTGLLFEHLNRPEQAQPPLAPAGLSARELEVLHYLAVDYSNQQIADQLVIDVRTVKHHVHNILQKLKVRHRWDAARLAQSRDWLQKL